MTLKVRFTTKVMSLQPLGSSYLCTKCLSKQIKESPKHKHLAVPKTTFTLRTYTGTSDGTTQLICYCRCLYIKGIPLMIRTNSPFQVCKNELQWKPLPRPFSSTHVLCLSFAQFSFKLVIQKSHLNT